MSIKNLKIGTRLGIGFAATLILLIAVAVIGVVLLGLMPGLRPSFEVAGKMM